MRRIVLDTNVLVGGAYDDLSASRRIIEACLAGELVAILSPPLRAEYEAILPRAVRIRGYAAQIRAFLDHAETVPLADIPSVVQDDPEDDKVIATAVAGRADALITNDRHLLDLDPYGGIRIIQPVNFENLRKEEHGEEWENLARMIGLPRTP